MRAENEGLTNPFNEIMNPETSATLQFMILSSLSTEKAEDYGRKHSSKVSDLNLESSNKVESDIER